MPDPDLVLALQLLNGGVLIFVFLSGLQDWRVERTARRGRRGRS